MKRFRFSLEAVATIRHHEEDQARQRFAEATRAHRAGVDRLEKTQQELAATMEERRASTARSATDHRQLQEWQNTLQQRVERQTEELKPLAKAVQQANQDLMLARQRHEAVEKIRSQRMSRHEQEGLKAEQKILDDLANRETLAQGLLKEDRV
ncbi:MAG: flagellar export protein FliJ [Verrucomicrobiales bacterium]|nr:flagellar export protein FliJ [Verrucomicrobiales bacterium]